MKKLILIFSILYSLIYGGIVKAQTDTVIITFVGIDTIPETEIIKTPTRNLYSYELDTSKIVTKKERLISQDGKILALAGLPYFAPSISPTPSQLEFFYCGKFIKGIYDKHQRMGLKMSDEGYVAVISFPQTDTILTNLYLTTYTPDGEEIFNKKIDNHYFRYYISISEKANYTALSLANELIIFDKTGNEVFKLDSAKGFSETYFYKDKYFIAKGYMFYIIDLENSKIIYNSPFRASFEFYTDNNYLIILGCNSTLTNSQPYIKYKYHVQIVDKFSGNIITKYELPFLINYTSDLCKINIIDNKNFNFTLKNKKYEFKIN